jgi:hypothetical protein
MDCKQYKEWLENRDLSDISESDRAGNHARDCTGCEDLTRKDEMLDQAISNTMKKEPLPENLEKIVAMNLSSGVSRTRRFSTGFIKLASLSAGVAAVLLVFFLIPADFSALNDFGTALVQDHNGILRGHPVDSVQNEKLPDWIGANADFAAQVPASFPSQGLELFGARICVIDRCRTVHLVYSTGAGFVSLFIIDADQLPAPLKDGKSLVFTQKGSEIKMWREGNQVFAMIS